MKIGVLYPEQKMVDDAVRFAKDYDLEVVYSKKIMTAEAVNEAREAIDAGAQLVLARGKQAMLIKQAVGIPVVETRFTAQEIGLLLKKSIEITGKEEPKVLFIGYDNMMPDLSYMETLFPIKLYISCIENLGEVGEAIDRVRDWNPDVIIGGIESCEYANRRGYLSLYYSATEESVNLAIQRANDMKKMMESQMQSDAQFETMIDTSFNGVIRINLEGTVLVVNHIIEELFEKKNENLIGQKITDLLPNLDMEQIEKILNGENEQYSTSINMKKEAWMLLVAPLKSDLQIRGAILSLRKTESDLSLARTVDRRMLFRGYTTDITFADIPSESAAMKKMVSQAKIFSMSERPVLLQIPKGTDGVLVAKAIHNSSFHRDGPFVSLDVACIPAENQREVLFGTSKNDSSLQTEIEAMEGVLYRAHYGSVYLKNIEYLDPYMQRMIVRTLMPWNEIDTDAQIVRDINVRFIVSTSKDIKVMMEEEKIEPEFFYMISSLQLVIPSLRECPEELRESFDRHLRKYMKRYDKYLKVTEGGYQALLSFPWDGNAMQIESFVERLVLTASKRTIDETVLNHLYEELYPKIVQINGMMSYVTYKSPEAVSIEEALREFSGNRQKAAKSLGMSTTTLWRKMKKYGLSEDLS